MRVVFAVVAGYVLLLSSPSTPPEALAAVKAAALHSEAVHLAITRDSLPSDEVYNDPVAVLDYTYDAGLSMQVPHVCTVCMYERCPERVLRGVFSPREYAAELSHYLSALGFSDEFLVGDSEGWDLEVVSALRKSRSFSGEAVLSELSAEEAALFVGRVLKPAGTNLAVCILQPSNAVHIIRSFHQYRLFEPGFAYVFSQQAVWGLYSDLPDLIDGLMFVSDRETALATSRVEYERVLLASQMRALSEAVEAAGDSPAAVRELLLASYGGKARNCASVLVNIRDSKPTVERPFLYPGNSTELPKLTQAAIYVSGDFSGMSSGGRYYAGGEGIVAGFLLGNKEVNERHDILPHFTLVNRTVSLGVIYDDDWALQQLLLYRDLLGVAFHAVPLSQNVMGVYAHFQHLNISVPIVTTAGSSRLSDPKEYPLFLRTTSSSLYGATVMARFFKLFGWTHTAFVYSPVEEDIDYYRCFLRVSPQYNIEITNNSTNRMISLTLEDEQLNATIKEILSSPVRIVIISHLYGHLVVERMYDLGARAGDFLILVPYGLSETYYQGQEEHLRKRRMVAKGAMMFFSELFVGAVGQSVWLRMKALGEVYQLGCAFYDCTMLVAHTLDFMVARGLHYEDGSELARAMRGTRFEGCIGHIQIESGTNDKTPSDYVIINMQVDDDYENITLKSVARYSPTKTQLFNLSESIQWPNGLRSFPDLWERDPHCPYYQRDIVDFSQGRIVSTAVCFFYSAATALVAVLVGLKWRRKKPGMLQKPKAITTEDVLALACVAFDCVQLAAVGPPVLTAGLSKLLRLTAFILEPVLTISQGAFWLTEAAAFVLVVLYLSLCALKVVGITRVLSGVCVFNSLCSLLEWLLPSLSSVLFLPAVYTFLSTFSCFQATGSNFTDSFLERDCYQRCWTGSHVLYSAFAGVLLFVYTPVALVTRPLLQDQHHLHLKAFPVPMLVKSVVQALLAAACASLQQDSHRPVYLSIISCYMLFSLRVKTYNYER